jgi:hypothetical protein
LNEHRRDTRIDRQSIAALYLALYEQAGYPHGKNKQGFHLWCQLKQSDFEHFCTLEDKQ